VRNARVTHYEDTPRDIVITGNDYPPHYVLPRHAHKRGQLLYAATGVVTVITPVAVGWCRRAAHCGFRPVSRTRCA